VDYIEGSGLSQSPRHMWKVPSHWEYFSFYMVILLEQKSRQKKGWSWWCRSPLHTSQVSSRSEYILFYTLFVTLLD